MKRLFVPVVVSLTFAYLTGCEPYEPPKKAQGGWHAPPPTGTSTTPVPVDDQSPPDEPTARRRDDPVEKPAPPAPPPKPVGELPYGKAVPGKPGFVTSPYDPYRGYIDVRGYPPGTEVKDPYSGKTFLVPPF